jgi:outer membrane lipoprotein carrier protein
MARAKCWYRHQPEPEPVHARGRPPLVASVLLGTLLGLLQGPAWARTDAADDAALARVERSLATLGSVRAEFTQELLEQDAKTPQRATGTLYIAKPGRFRWDYTTPKQLIVCDGTRLWLYDPELEQVTVRAVRDTLSQTPAMLLSGDAHVGDGFVVHDGGRSEGLEWVRLTPRRDDADFRELRLGFAGEVLRRLEFSDKLNAVTRIVLTRVERNVRLDDALFRFVPPAGVDVIGGGSR